MTITPETSIKQLYLKRMFPNLPARNIRERFVQLMGEDERRKRVERACEDEDDYGYD
jgi:hypothetical protein